MLNLVCLLKKFFDEISFDTLLLFYVFLFWWNEKKIIFFSRNSKQTNEYIYLKWHKYKTHKFRFILREKKFILYCFETCAREWYLKERLKVIQRLCNIVSSSVLFFFDIIYFTLFFFIWKKGWFIFHSIFIFTLVSVTLFLNMKCVGG